MASMAPLGHYQRDGQQGMHATSSANCDKNNKKHPIAVVYIKIAVYEYI
jgi:hypothetical protein